MNESPPSRPHQHEIVVPELGLNDTLITVSSWLAPVGKAVAAGEQLVELLAGEVMLNLPSQVDGVLLEKRVPSDQQVEVGEVLGVIACDDPE